MPTPPLSKTYRPSSIEGSDPLIAKRCIDPGRDLLIWRTHPPYHTHWRKSDRNGEESTLLREGGQLASQCESTS